ncbi:hypothetical protein COU57_04055 [Candidatus Pacearchaeota archaeon CG10_big_fil_rev_8_21_14_0_10_32_14]|nr:MAG: hypothetical protein COU57_04055 [Candidatus Pacearchaeota archaeon CG10_big_fil_rev_8_21_14_0_10_32_14]
MEQNNSYKSQNESEEVSQKEKRVRNLTALYYSRPEIQKAMYEFSKNREIAPRFFEGFGKRPDVLQYYSDIFSLSQKGATSFHCSEELWSDPLQIVTGMNEKQANELRIGWDLLIDIDSKYIDYSKVCAKIIIKFLEFQGIKNIGIKFSGSKGFHIIVPWKAFPKIVFGQKSSEMFPEWPRIISRYITERVKDGLVKELSKLTIGPTSAYIKDQTVSQLVMPDIILVSSRHLFRMPYSLHEKTALASIVLDKDKIMDFDVQDANPLKVTKEKIYPFNPENTKDGEASRLLMQALDWYKDQNINEDTQTQSSRNFDFKPIKLEKISDEFFPPSIKQILQGVQDGRKRALFILINLFRSIGMEKDELEKRIYDWNNKNEVQLKTGYIKSQLMWSYRNKIVPPPNFDKYYYQGIGVIPTPEEIRLRNPINYVLKKSEMQNQNQNKVKKK